MGTGLPSTGRATRRRKVVLVGLPAAITVGWFVAVTITGAWGRVVTNWESTLTMIFGSFVAGATPQGGGAVAFPVFTKVLQTPADVARTFSLSIQAVGMVTASLAIILSGKPIQRRSVVVGGAAGIAGFLAGLFLLGDPETPFWSARIPDEYIKVTFTVVLAALAYIVYLALDEDDCGMPDLPVWNTRMWAGLVMAGVLGGVASAMLGSGTDVTVFLFIVIVAGLHPRSGVPTSVLAMAMVSAVGFLTLGLIDGQLVTTVEAGRVVSVGGAPIVPVAAERFDIYGLWLAAVPVVVWGAPLGTMFVHTLGEKRLILFLAAMAALEVVSTGIFLTRLWQDPVLLGYAVLALVGAVWGVRWLHAHRTLLLADAAPPEAPPPRRH